MAELKSFGAYATNVYESKLARSINARISGSTARQEWDIKIHFAYGASHTSWKGGKQAVQPAARVAFWLVNGTGFTAMGRPFFDEYLSQNWTRIQRMLRRHIEEGEGKIYERFEEAGEEIKRDLINWLYAGGMSDYPNFGRYATEKGGHGYGGNPCVATGELFQDLEVTIE